ncbi:hypothetical protein L6164_029302 [Bauhinia variegata]|uniref:Uncharacterized protein n=1 Tax=Bauhinia variegata TaxID=167791 RepID=A0ACB9L8A1_BAUVA|nr:hypothetical protein L6164_029302 [Bauhinia variegata]
MAFHVSSACFTVLGHSRLHRIRAVASEGSSTLKIDEDEVKLGGSDLKVTRLGIGAWSWGDASYWNNFEWNDRKEKAARNAFNASVDSGITFFDTAEIYGSWYSLGAINSGVLLGRPGVWGNEGYLDGLGDAFEQGFVKAVGVSNYNEKRLREAYEKLKRRGIQLASNQVNYSLIYRVPEENGVKAACDELGITVIAYCPIAQGALTGKYTPENPPTGPRGLIYTPEYLRTLQSLLNRVSKIGEKYNKTSTQVALNWLIAQGNVVPIPGAKTAEQALEFTGALG